MSYQHVFTAVDIHTTGEPTRVVVAGIPFLSGTTMAEKRRQLREEYDLQHGHQCQDGHPARLRPP